MNRRLLAIIMSALICSSFFACGKADNEIPGEPDDLLVIANSTEATVPKIDPTTQAATEEISVDTTESFTEPEVTQSVETTIVGSVTTIATPVVTTPVQTVTPAVVTQAPTAAPVKTGMTTEDMKFSFGGVNVTVTSNSASLLSVLGTPVRTSVEPSCYYDGDDKVFEYDALTITTYPLNGADCICEILLKKDTVSTTRGLKVGMALADAENLYGKSKKVSNMYCFYPDSQDESIYLYVTLSGDKIKTIGYIKEIS